MIANLSCMQSSGSAGSATQRRMDRRSAEIGPAGAAPQERVSLTLQRISVQAPGAGALIS